MNDCLISNYSLTSMQVVQSILISEFGVRHYQEFSHSQEYKWEHLIIAIIELCPLLGALASLVEYAIACCCVFTQPVVRLLPSWKITWIVQGSQAGCTGSVNMQRVLQVFQEIVQNRAGGVTFNEVRLKDTIKQGTCSAMSLDLIRAYLECKQDRLITMDDLKRVGQKYITSSQEMKDCQMAFNSIELALDEIADGVDIERNKMQSLANFYHLTIDDASSFMDITQISFEDFKEEIDSLPKGTYVIRAICPDDNHKGEKWGHTLVYNNDGCIPFFYDPNGGILNLEKEDHGAILFRALGKCNIDFETNMIRFYRIAEHVNP
ncbi:MAG: hypothetical protein HY860_04410 [Chlamydiales bacterium]|nr:hypothetical protein [Chlamydiales bacterium]